MTMNKKTTTKDRILDVALDLFSERGFDGVSVEEIAKGVGIKAPSLYKHYAGKKAIFDAIIEQSKLEYDNQMSSMDINFLKFSNKEEYYINMTLENQIHLIKELFLYLTQSKYPILFRKLATVEQFRHPEIGEMFNKRYIKSQFDAFEILMKILIKGGVMKNYDPKTMAVQYISPVSLLIGVCDRDPGFVKEAVKILEDHIRQFNQVYSIKNN